MTVDLTLTLHLYGLHCSLSKSFEFESLLSELRFGQEDCIGRRWLVLGFAAFGHSEANRNHCWNINVYQQLGDSSLC